MSTQNLKGVLLVNLGTPDSYDPRDVYKYLIEFLTDARVIDFPWWRRQLFVRGFIVPTRYRQSAELYKKLWTDKGSPLLVHGRAVENALQQSLGPSYKVALGMRYQNPSIAAALEKLRKANVHEIIVVPLFPQYSSATTGSVNQKVMETVKDWMVIPKMTFINSFATHPSFIRAFAQRGRQYPISTYDAVVFSFHGLPERQIRKCDNLSHCLKPTCCETFDTRNTHCYRAQCYSTARAIAAELSIESYQVCFQSRLGKEPWLKPYASDLIHDCAKAGKKKLLVFSPSFVCDCLETTSEISEEYGTEFKKLGGEELQLVEGLNSHPAWIEALQSIVKQQ